MIIVSKMTIHCAGTVQMREKSKVVVIRLELCLRPNNWIGLWPNRWRRKRDIGLDYESVLRNRVVWLRVGSIHGSGRDVGGFFLYWMGQVWSRVTHSDQHAGRVTRVRKDDPCPTLVLPGRRTDYSGSSTQCRDVDPMHRATRLGATGIRKQSKIRNKDRPVDQSCHLANRNQKRKAR